MTGKFRVEFEDGPETELVGRGEDKYAALLDLVTALTSGVLLQMAEHFSGVACVEYMGEEDEEDEEGEDEE